MERDKYQKHKRRIFRGWVSGYSRHTYIDACVGGIVSQEDSFNVCCLILISEKIRNYCLDVIKLYFNYGNVSACFELVEIAFRFSLETKENISYLMKTQTCYCTAFIILN